MSVTRHERVFRPMLHDETVMAGRNAVGLRWRRLTLIMIAAATGGSIALVLGANHLVAISWLVRLMMAAMLVIVTGWLSWRICASLPRRSR